jgi:organic hydroperoxide reductase OsmC/OhrA
VSHEPAVLDVSGHLVPQADDAAAVADDRAAGSGPPARASQMISVTREATIKWLGHPPGGEPRLTVGSHSLTPSPSLNLDLDIRHPLATSPLELLAGAIGSVFARFVAEQLVKEGTPASEIVTRAILTLSGEADDQSDLAVRAVACQLSARVAGIDDSHLQAVAETALSRCMESLAMRTEGIAITVKASLEGS